MERSGLQCREDLVVLGKATALVLGEDELAVAQHVELALAARDVLRLDPVRVQLGCETRSPLVIARSGGAVVDLDRHAASLPVGAAAKKWVARLRGMREGEVGTEIAPIIEAGSEEETLAERVDALLRRTCRLARALTGAEQAALKLWVDGDTAQARKYFSLSAKYADYRDYRVNPSGLGLHGIDIPPGDVIRLTQAQVEAHPAWQAFGAQARVHPPMRGWLATSVCGEDGRRYGMLQLSDKQDDADFTEEDADSVRELAGLVGETLDALRVARGT